MIANLSPSQQIKSPAQPVERLPIGPVIAGCLACLAVVGVAAGVARLFLGLGATTGLTDSTSWGIWIGFDFSLIAISGAAFTLAAAVHVLHIESLKPALRPALFTGLLGYVAVLVILLLDLGRPDRFYSFLINWNFHSPLFEISWCVLLYSTVLMLEVSPDAFTWLGWERPKLWVGWIMAPVTIVGVTLSTLHQSTLGTLYLNMPHRLHPLWYSPLLPVLFFTSAVMVGFASTTIAYRLAVRIKGAQEQPSVLNALGKGMLGAGAVYLALRLVAMAWTGQIGRLASEPAMAALLLLELGVGVLLPLALLWRPGVRTSSAAMWWLPAAMILGVGMNRFTSTIYAQTAPLGPSVYAPHLFEWLTTIGIIAAAALAWYLAVRFLVSFEPGRDAH
jgi:Ni/Fe-hydrogenase subunit HybB-like protein